MIDNLTIELGNGFNVLTGETGAGKSIVIDSINGKNASQDAIFIAAGIYLFLTYGISKLLSLLEKKMNLTSKPLPSSN